MIGEVEMIDIEGSMDCNQRDVSVEDPEDIVADYIRYFSLSRDIINTKNEILNWLTIL